VITNVPLGAPRRVCVKGMQGIDASVMRMVVQGTVWMSIGGLLPGDATLFQSDHQVHKLRSSSGKPDPRVRRPGTGISGLGHSRSGWFVHQEVADAVRVNRDTGTHGGGEVHLLQVTALGGRGLAAHHLIERGRVVLHQLLGVE
jgi:hypothetical protein